MKRIIPFYIIRELLPSFFANILVFTFILLMVKILQLTELVVVRGVKVGTIFHMLALNLPFLLSMTIPMSTLLAVLTAFMRLSDDSEITVIKSSGVSLYQLLPPVVLFCLWTYLLTTYLTLIAVPASNWAFRQELLDLAKTRADIGIKERVFNVGFKKMVLFVNHMSLDSDLMEDIFIKDESDPEVTSVIVASRGRLATDPEEGVLVLHLYQGAIDRIYRGMDSTETIDFERYELKIALEGELGDPTLMKQNQMDMPTYALWGAIERLKEEGNKLHPIYLMEAHRRFSLPLACLVLGLAAVPLGVQVRGRGRNWGLTIGLVIFLFYYILLSAAWSFGESGRYPPALGMWVPNILIGGAALYMLRQANRESPIRIVTLLNRLPGLFQRIQRRNRS